MIDILKNLEKNNIYTWLSNNFNKLLLSKDYLSIDKSFLVVVENSKQVNNYIKISSFLWLKLYDLDNLIDFVNVFYNNISNYIATQEIFNLETENISNFEYNNIFKISKWQQIEINELSKKLNELNIKFSDSQNPYTFFIMWDTLTYTDKTWQLLKISFWDNEIDQIIYWDKNLDYFVFWFNKSLHDLEFTRNSNNYFLDKYKSSNNIFTLIDNIDFYASFDDIYSWLDNYIVFSSLWNHENSIDLWYSDLLIQNLDDLKLKLEDKNIKKFIFTKNKKTINNFLDLNNLDDVIVFESNLNNLKSFKSKSIFVICDDNISRIFIKKRVKRSISENMDLLMQIKSWDYVVHIDHWIWVFKEIITKEFPSWKNWALIKKEYLTIEYKNDDKLFVPITEVYRLSKYVWVENPKLTWLSTKDWAKKLKKVSEDVEQIAWELLDIFAKRKLEIWHSFKSKPELEAEFFNSFEYTYTPDQYNVINEIYKDMESENPMDRLLSWDVWFWKTEVAFAAIYKSLINWKQAALISPLVVLAYEHFEKARERFNDFPFNIEVVTRFEKPSVIKSTLKKLAEWKIDLIIGTHRLLSQDVEFKDLWLLVIDEEHKFWVKDKEKIKWFKGNIDILSMSATPIPRSLNMALNWLKQVSMLTTAPVWKQPVQTIVSSLDDKLIIEACKREFSRWWQVFFIHNRVETISWFASYLEKLLPWKKVVIAHWQLWGDLLERRIIDFKQKKYDILLATTVIENWIDFRDVNTIFINDAMNFWISQIHQLRWRVGRWANNWYCYLLFRKDKIKEDAAKRLKTIVDYSHLWAWFELAVKDLEIRWWWDILWIRQSWSSVEVWVSLFLEMLEDKIEQLKNEQNIYIWEDEIKTKKINTTIDLNIESYISDEYFSWELDKINFYREIESIRTLEDLNNLISDFEELNNTLAKETLNLFNLLRLKILSSQYKISSIKKIGINYQIDFDLDIEVADLRKFLDMDRDTNFVVVSPTRLRSSIKNFAHDEKFVEYLLLIFNWSSWKRKIKLKAKI